MAAEAGDVYLSPMNSKLFPRFTVVLLGLIVWAFLGSACNTTRGLGKDVEKLGDKIQDKSR
jgi:predicted small secreted protein